MLETGGQSKCAYKCTELAAGLLEVDLFRMGIPEANGPLSLLNKGNGLKIAVLVYVNICNRCMLLRTLICSIIQLML